MIVVMGEASALAGALLYSIGNIRVEGMQQCTCQSAGHDIFEQMLDNQAAQEHTTSGGVLDSAQHCCKSSGLATMLFPCEDSAKYRMHDNSRVWTLLLVQTINIMSPSEPSLVC